MGISLLPTDTSLREAQRLGALSVCLPDSFAPLMTADPARPSIEVDLLQEIAAELGLRLNIRRIAAMGRDFDPAGARISRGQCAVLGGREVGFTLTRDRQDMLCALQEDRADIAILGAFDGQSLATENGYALQPLPAPFGSSTLVFGLWKGDLTLKRGIERALGKIRQDGRLARIISRYQQPD